MKIPHYSASDGWLECDGDKWAKCSSEYADLIAKVLNDIVLGQADSMNYADALLSRVEKSEGERDAWKNRAELAEARISRARKVIEYKLKFPSYTDGQKGYAEACLRIQDMLNSEARDDD